MTKKLIYIFMICLSSFILISCSEETTQDSTNKTTTYIQTGTTTKRTLEAPENLAHTDNVISWDEVSGATEYEVHIGDLVEITSYSEYTITLEGTYDVYVIAKDIACIDSEASSTITVTLNYEHTVEFNVTLTDNIISWDAIDDATEYKVLINGVTHTTTDTTYTISGYDPGIVHVSIQAVFPIGTSNYSERLYYENNLNETDPLYIQYSMNSTANITLWTIEQVVNTVIMNSDSEALDLNNVIVNSDHYLTLNSDYVKTLELGENSIFVVIGSNKTDIVITLHEKTVPYIISSTSVYTDGSQDISFQLELFGGSLYSVNGTAEDTVIYELNNDILTIKSEFITNKFINDDLFVLSIAMNHDDLSVVSYMFFHKE